MYKLLLSVIAVVLVIVAVLILDKENQGGETTSPNVHEDHAKNHVKSRNSFEILVSPEDRRRFFIHPDLGLYNMSVRRTETGYSGVIRSSTWNNCKQHNTYPAFSEVYYISTGHDGHIESLERVELDYEKFKHRNRETGPEDPRSFLFAEEEWVICNSLGLLGRHNNVMGIFKISDPKNTFTLLAPPKGVEDSQRQKNWSPFEYNGGLHCEYSIVPHIVLRVNVRTGTVEESWESCLSQRRDACSLDYILSDTSLRGGTPPILLSNPGKNSKLPESFYLAMGHKRDENNFDYFNFFYAFRDSPPFQILSITAPFKLDGDERIQIVGCLSLDGDGRNGEGKVYISSGVDDCFNRISQFTTSDVMRLLESS